MMEYELLKTPEDLLKFMDCINYGFVDADGVKYGTFDEDAFEENVLIKWKLSSPERLLDVKYGHCFDQVELERDWFTKHNYNFKTYYIMFLFDYPNEYTTHTFLIYEQNNKWWIFEHSDGFERGIVAFHSLDDALKYKMERHIEHNKRYNKVGLEEIKCLHVYEYDKPLYGATFREFIDNILEHSKDVTPNILD